MWSSVLIRRVFVAFAALILIAALLFALLVSHSQEEELRRQLMEQLRVSSVLLSALDTGTGHAQRYSSTLTELHLYSACRVDREGEVIGVPRSSLLVNTIQPQVRQGRLRVWVFTAIVAAAALACTGLLLARIISPLLTLTRAVDRMKAGHLVSMSVSQIGMRWARWPRRLMN